MKDKSSVDEGLEAIAQAVAYGMGLAWSSPMVKTAFAVGIVPPPVPPVLTTVGNPAFGSSMHSALLGSLTEA